RGRSPCGALARALAAPAADDPDRPDHLVPFVAEPVRRRGGEGDRVAGLEDELVESDHDTERAAEDVAELVPAVADEVVIGTRGTARLVGRLDEFDVFVGPERQPLPRHTGVERDRSSFVGALYGQAGLCYGGGRVGARRGRGVLRRWRLV